MRTPGVEPGSQAWEACMMPLHYVRAFNSARAACSSSCERLCEFGRAVWAAAIATESMLQPPPGVGVPSPFVAQVRARTGWHAHGRAQASQREGARGAAGKLSQPKDNSSKHVRGYQQERASAGEGIQARASENKASTSARGQARRFHLQKDQV